MNNNRGIYCLIVDLKPDIYPVGALGCFSLGGLHAYAGSAQASLSGRIGRHLKKDKKLRWHIDYISRGIIRSIVFIKQNAPGTAECALAAEFNRHFPEVKGFGASDCSCSSHFFKIDDRRKLDVILARQGLIKWDVKC